MKIESLDHCLNLPGGWICHLVKRLADVAIYKGLRKRRSQETAYFVIDVYTVPVFMEKQKVGHQEKILLSKIELFKSYSSARDRAIELLNFEE